MIYLELIIVLIIKIYYSIFRWSTNSAKWRNSASGHAVQDAGQNSATTTQKEDTTYKECSSNEEGSAPSKEGSATSEEGSATSEEGSATSEKDCEEATNQEGATLSFTPAINIRDTQTTTQEEGSSC